MNSFATETFIKNHAMKTLSVIVIFLVSFYYPKQVQGSSNSFKIESAVPCPNNKKLAATFLNMNSFNTNGKLCVNAEIELKETIKGPIPVIFCFSSKEVLS